MSEPTKYYSITGITFNFLKVPLDSLGAWDDAGVKLEKVDADYVDKKASDGSIIRVATNSRAWKVTLSILHTAGANAVLSGIHYKDQASLNGSGVGRLVIADRGGNSTFSASEAWITKWPNISFGKEPAPVEWEFMAADGKPFWGGS